MREREIVLCMWTSIVSWEPNIKREHLCLHLIKALGILCDLLTRDANPKFSVYERCYPFLFTISILWRKWKFFFTLALSNIKLHVCLTEHIFTITGSIAKGSVQSAWNSSHLFRFTCKNIYVLPRTASVASFKEWLSMQIGIISAWNNL